jgi:Ca-activated chloride channel family protein
MSRGPIQAVRTALHQLVDRLKPQDRFGVVVFNDEALVQVPTRPMADHDAATVDALIEAITPQGTTDLSAGYLLGLSEARRHATETGASVLLLSDGHANRGVTDPAQLGSVAAKARAESITTTTIGIGQGYDEVLLAEVATQGSGSHRFAFTDDDAIAVVSEEAGDLLSKSILNAVARIRPTDPAMVDRIGTLHDVPRWIEADADGIKHLVVPLGDLYAGEERQLLLHFPVPALASLGLHQLAQVSIEYVALPDLLEQVVAWPLMVNVVPGDEAAGRVLSACAMPRLRSRIKPRMPRRSSIDSSWRPSSPRSLLAAPCSGRLASRPSRSTKTGIRATSVATTGMACCDAVRRGRGKRR